MTARRHRGGFAVKQVHQRGCAAVCGARGHCCFSQSFQPSCSRIGSKRTPGLPSFLRNRTIGEPISGNLHEPKRSEENTSELQSLMRISYAVFCLKKKKKKN